MYEHELDSRDGYDAIEYEAWLDAQDEGWQDELDAAYEDEPWDGFRDDVEADADVLRNCGWGTDEDYGLYDGGEDW